MVENVEVGPDTDLYALLGIYKFASVEEVKRAYYRKALAYHPDRHVNATVEEKEKAKKAFQALGLAYSVLSDEKRKKEYDETGNIYEDGEGIGNWNEYLDKLYKRVTTELIDEFSKAYKKSEEERQDIYDLYKEHKGSMSKIIDNLLLGSEDEECRYRTIIQLGIENGDLKDFKEFHKMDAREKARRLKRAKKEAVEASKEAKRLGLDNNFSLSKAIVEKKRTVDDLLNRLATKYGGEAPLLDDADFDSFQQSMLKSKKKNKK